MEELSLYVLPVEEPGPYIPLSPLLILLFLVELLLLLPLVPFLVAWWYLLAAPSCVAAAPGC